MQLTDVCLLIFFMNIYALEVLSPINMTIVHRVMDFGPYYGDSCFLIVKLFIISNYRSFSLV